MKIIFLIIVILGLWASSCETPPPQPTAEISPVHQDDITKPVLLRISPSHEQKLGDFPHTTVDIIGIIQDESPLTGTINELPLKLSYLGNKQYQFKISLPLIPGENTVLLHVRDTHGNLLQREITYYNGDAPKLILRPERQQLPPGGTTFFEVFLEQNNQQHPLPIEDIELRAQRGYFEGSQYQAPHESGADHIFAYYKQQNAKGNVRLMIMKGNISLKGHGPQQTRLGENTEYTIQIANEGNIESVQNILSVKIPSGCEFVEANHAGKYLGTVGEIHWQLPKLGPGVQDTVQFTIKGTRLGADQFYASLSSGEENLAKTEIPFQIVGIVTIHHSCEESSLLVDQPITIQVKLTAQEELKDLKFTYHFDAEKIAFIKVKGEHSQSITLNFEVSGDKVILNPSVEAAAQDCLDIVLHFKVRRVGKINNRVECIATFGNQRQVLEDSLVLYAE